MTINFSTLFTRLGKGFALGNTILTNITTDVPTDLEDFLDQLSALDEVDQADIVQGIDGALAGFQSGGSSGISSMVKTTCERILVLTVKEDDPQLNENVQTAVDEIIRQMLLTGDTLDASTPAVSINYGEGAGSSSGPPAGNTGTGIIVASVKRGDGLVNEHILAETIEADISAVSTDGSATWKLTGEKAAPSIFDWEWPLGSGASRSITAQVGEGGDNELTNGSFETESDEASNLPDGWIAPVATLGTTLKLTDVEVQTVIISGTPTGGFYHITWTDGDGVTYWTQPLAYNAGQSDVQTALRAIPGLGSVTVSSSGTSPNYTHTITLTGVTNPAQFSSDDNLTGGTAAIAHATSTPASQYVLRGAVSLELDSNGSELTTIMCPVTLDPQTQYAFCGWFASDVNPAAGVITVDLVDGIGGTTLADDEGTTNSQTIDCTTLSGAWGSRTAVFRTPLDLPDTVYLRIRITTPVSSGTSVFVDEVCLVAMTEFYTGGPYIAAFAGGTDHLEGDDARIVVTNDRAGALHEWMNRVFDLRANRKLIPTDNAGAETIDDALIA